MLFRSVCGLRCKGVRIWMNQDLVEESLSDSISISRAGDVTGNPNLKVKVLSGSYNIKIKAKTEADGKCRIYAERLQYTPILDALLMNSYGISMKMEAADNSAFEGGFEATFDL